MRITANQVTLARLLLLPVPIAMLYQGGTTWMLVALAVYILIGLTDALDGILARRYGSTPLGELLDPIVDKIFVVAAYIPLADHQVISIFFVSAIFIRELAVTVLRSIALEERFDFRTSRVAKLKTTVQMVGAAFLLLVWLFPRDEVILTILAFTSAGSLVPVLISFARRGRPGWKAIWGAVLFVVTGVVRYFFDRGTSLIVIVIVVLGFTVLSGLEYAWGMRRVLAARFRRQPIDALRLAGQSLAIPGLLLPPIEFSGRLAFVIMGVLAAELAVVGLDNSLVQVGVRRGPRPDLLRFSVQGAAGLLLLLVLPGSEPPPWIVLPVWLALAATLSDLGVRFVRNIDVFRVANSKPVAPTAAVSSSESRG